MLRVRSIARGLPPLQRTQLGPLLSIRPKLLERRRPLLCGGIHAEAARRTQIRNTGGQCAMHPDPAGLRELPSRT